MDTTLPTIEDLCKLDENIESNPRWVTAANNAFAVNLNNVNIDSRNVDMKLKLSKSNEPTKRIQNLRLTSYKTLLKLLFEQQGITDEKVARHLYGVYFTQEWHGLKYNTDSPCYVGNDSN